MCLLQFLLHSAAITIITQLLLLHKLLYCICKVCLGHIHAHVNQWVKRILCSSVINNQKEFLTALSDSCCSASSSSTSTLNSRLSDFKVQPANTQQ